MIKLTSNIKFKFTILGAFFLLITSLATSQSLYEVGLLPSITLSKPLPNDYSLNFKVEFRQDLFNGFFDEPVSIDYRYNLTDISIIGAKKIGVRDAAAIGYLMRIVENRLVHRLIQQLSFTKNYTGFKLSHRFRADQTFHEQISTQYRFRYRLASEIALDGLNVDPKEFYLKINNEYLNILRNGVYDLEIRLTPFLGYKFTDSQKLEIGIDYRFKSFIRDTVLHQFWLGINWYQVF